MPLHWAVLFALCTHIALGTGDVLMKSGIAWIDRKQRKDRLYFKNLLLWMFGFLVMNSSGVFTALAVKRLPPERIGAFAGAGIVSMVLLSRLLLGEKLHASDAWGSAMILAAITLLSLDPAPDDPSAWINPSPWSLLAVLLFPLFLLPTGFFSTKTAAACALVSGQASGILVILLKILVARYNYRITSYFSSPFLYLYIAFALLALFTLQLALKRGPMMQAGPLQYSGLVLYPALCAPLFGILPLFRHWLLFLLSLAGIWIILRRR